VRKLLIIILSLTIPLGILYTYFFYSAETDDLVIALRDVSFLPVRPPSNLHTVGAIYYIEPELGTVTKLCEPTKEISDRYIHKSRSAVVSGARTLQGTYVSKIKAKTVGGKSSVDDRRSIKVHYELTNVHVSAIAVDSSKTLYDQLMNTKDCSDMVTKYLDLSGYICQDLQLLEASASFKLNSESDTGASLDLDTERALASEVEARMNVRLTEGRSTAGEGLQWGIQMARLCITPTWARYPRTLPRNNFDRMLNFIKFNILEPILPAT
jgi:hypothetical protein